MRFTLSALALAVWVGSSNAGEIVRMKGVDAPTTNLKGKTADEAETIAVFHGLFGCCHRKAYCCQPVVVSSGCSGCYGGMGAGNGAAAPNYGYQGQGTGYAPMPYTPAPSYAYRTPTRSYYYAPAPSYARPMQNYSPAPSGAIVTLPRLGLSFTLGGNGLLAARSAAYNRILPPDAASPGEADPVDPPQPRSQPDQFRYDGGPANPIPMPGEAPRPAPTLNNRVRLSAVQPGYLAYGERPNTARQPNSVLVKGR